MSESADLISGEAAPSRQELAQLVRRQDNIIEALDDRVQTLEERVEEQDQAREEAIRQQEIKRSQMFANKLGDLRDDIQDVHEEVIDEQKTRSRADAKIERRISHIADDLSVEVSEDDIMGDDRLMRLARNGAEDAVVGSVYKVHKRARDLLVNMDTWADVTNLHGQRAAVYTAPAVKPYLESTYDKSFSTSEVKRVFEKIVELGEDSPRKVRKDKDGENRHRLIIWKPQPLIEATEGMA